MSDRDLIGYGSEAPHPDWPGRARIALNFVLNVEEGSEQAVGDGDPGHEAHLTEVTASPVAPGQRDHGAESMFEYGARVGVWRILRRLEARGVPATVFGCALALERNPPLAREIRRLGHDVCSHGYRWERHYRLDEAGCWRFEQNTNEAGWARCTPPSELQGLF